MIKNFLRWLVKKELCQQFQSFPVGIKELILRCDSTTLGEVVYWMSNRFGEDWVNKEIFFDVISRELDALDGKETYLKDFFEDLRKEIRDRNPWFQAMKIRTDLTRKAK